MIKRVNPTPIVTKRDTRSAIIAPSNPLIMFQIVTLQLTLEILVVAVESERH